MWVMSAVLTLPGRAISGLRIPLWREGSFAQEHARLVLDRLYAGEGVEHGRGEPVLLVPGLLAGDRSLDRLRGWLRRIGYDATPAGIRVNALAPGVTRTAMTSGVSDDLLRAVPLSRIAEPEEIAAAVVWLCSPHASYVTGAVLVADGGWLAG